MKFDCCIFQFPCCFEAHDAKTNNPPKSTACKRLPITNTLTTLKHSPWKRSAQYHRVTVSGVISGATAYQPPLPPCRVGNMLHSISGQFKVGCGRGGGEGTHHVKGHHHTRGLRINLRELVVLTLNIHQLFN